MTIEIERKFLVNDEWTKHITLKTQRKYIRQGFLSSQKDCVVRVRISDSIASLTIKGLSTGISKPEFEYAIPIDDAKFMLDNLCEPGQIEKTRYIIPYYDEANDDYDYSTMKWEVDEFHGENAGLVVAEIELTSEEQKIYLPDWISKEVSKDIRYFNSNLSKKPFSKWYTESDADSDYVFNVCC
jgi:adenylate cyclase